jgi:hypothetical protein
MPKGSKPVFLLAHAVFQGGEGDCGTWSRVGGGRFDDLSGTILAGFSSSATAALRIASRATPPDRCCGGHRMDMAEGRSSFLKKRSKKLLCFRVVPAGSYGFLRAPGSKSFLVLFFQKRTLLLAGSGCGCGDRI